MDGSLDLFPGRRGFVNLLPEALEPTHPFAGHVREEGRSASSRSGPLLSSDRLGLAASADETHTGDRQGGEARRLRNRVDVLADYREIVDARVRCRVRDGRVGRDPDHVRRRGVRGVDTRGGRDEARDREEAGEARRRRVREVDGVRVGGGGAGEGRRLRRKVDDAVGRAREHAGGADVAGRRAAVEGGRERRGGVGTAVGDGQGLRSGGDGESRRQEDKSYRVFQEVLPSCDEQDISGKVNDDPARSLSIYGMKVRFPQHFFYFFPPRRTFRPKTGAKARLKFGNRWRTGRRTRQMSARIVGTP